MPIYNLAATVCTYIYIEREATEEECTAQHVSSWFPHGSLAERTVGRSATASAGAEQGP